MLQKPNLLGEHALRLLLLASYARASIWSVDIDQGPAPAPEDGPPLSAHASRNPALLPGQICGIIGAYLGIALMLGTLLLTIGRRMRRAAQLCHNPVSTEMVKPMIKQFDDSPISPRSQRSWYSSRRLKKKRSIPGSTRTVSNPSSPAVLSIASFDPGVIEADKVARQYELEQLYAAALAQEAAQSQASMAKHEPSLPVSTSLRRAPPRLLTSAPALAHLHVQDSQYSPVSPKSPIRAIYPPSSPYHNATSPISTRRAEYAQPNPQNWNVPISPNAPSTHTRTSSLNSQVEAKRVRKGMRNLRIQHHPRYPGEVSDEEVRTPLSPRYYTHSGIPPSPPPKSEAPTTPGTHDGFEMPVDVQELDQIRAIPRPEPQRTRSYQYDDSQAHAGPSRQTELKLDTNIGSGQRQLLSSRTPLSNASSTGALPFRSMGHSNDLPPSSPSLVTKVTYLERRRDLLNGPRTGMITPYSPYMPFTPITPITPHLTSRAERRQREREQNRRAPGEHDQVIDEDEMWGSGY